MDDRCCAVLVQAILYARLPDIGQFPQREVQLQPRSDEQFDLMDLLRLVIADLRDILDYTNANLIGPRRQKTECVEPLLVCADRTGLHRRPLLSPKVFDRRVGNVLFRVGVENLASDQPLSSLRLRKPAREGQPYPGDASVTSHG